MRPQDYKKFKDLHENGELLDPSLPGGAIAGLALKADPSLSGKFVNWNDKEAAQYALE
jgi:hypothetical protein